MTMKLSSNVTDIQAKFLASVANGEDASVQESYFGELMAAVVDESKKVAQAEVEAIAAANPQEAKMSARERKFFNEVKEGIPTGVVEVLPEETVDRIFEDLTTQHPLLAQIGLKNAGLRLKFIDSEATGKAEWGEVFGEIKGQLKQAFKSTKAIQHKLTAYVALPKDLSKFGPAWIQTYVMTQIHEAFAVALEAGFLNGTGSGQPLGLTMSTKGEVSGEDTTYKAKDPTGTLTFADAKTTVSDLTIVHKHHSVKEDGVTPVPVEGNLVMVVNPADAWDVKKQFTSLNANGVFVTAMPYNMIVIESVAQKSGKVTTFVKGRYDAYIAGNVEVVKYDQTYALEDQDLYTAKQFAYGRAKDERAAAVWTLQVETSLPGA
ncbi:TPA: phage major capsid protein [Streptococcus suis]